MPLSSPSEPLSSHPPSGKCGDGYKGFTKRAVAEQPGERGSVGRLTYIYIYSRVCVCLSIVKTEAALAPTEAATKLRSLLLSV